MSGLTSSAVSSKELQETKPLVVMQTIEQKKITDLLEWMRSDLGISEKFEENEKDAAHFVTRILELHKMNTQKVKKYIYKYYKSRSAGGAEVFQNRNSESDEILKSCQSVYLFTLPHLTKGGQRIIYSKIAPGTKADDFDQKAFFKRFFMVSDIRFKEEASSNGDLFIFDMEGFTRSHAMKLFSGGYMNKFIKSLKETYPRKLNTIHIIRTKPWHKNAIGIWLKMSGLSKKILDRVKTHPVQEEGLEGLGVQMEQLSGRLQDLNDAMTQRLIAHSTWFESREVKFKTLTIKSIKLDKPKGKSNPEEQLYISSNSEIYTFKSLEGIFRQINVDDK